MTRLASRSRQHTPHMAHSRLLRARLCFLVAALIVTAAVVWIIAQTRQHAAVPPPPAFDLPTASDEQGATPVIRLPTITLWQPFVDPPPPPATTVRARQPLGYSLVAIVSRDGSPAAMLQAEDQSQLLTLTLSSASSSDGREGELVLREVTASAVVIHRGNDTFRLELPQ